ncbi:DNA alkylation repair protein [Neptunicella marina]|uniref:DNA alkylation repair protein n=1 Tax=Neptunicella marina TaxID=2125989 RepID=A0A8J6M1L6_9ALTE|nr:DNA alkylation repair protein [Neptunicella marina]MBC3765593.1 DNA alkylation repair protein [Neptunicella marina]
MFKLAQTDSQNIDVKHNMKNNINQHSVETVATAFTQVWPQFNRESFEQHANNGLDKLELKARVKHIIQALKQNLPEDFNQTAALYNKLVEAQQSQRSLNGFTAWPVIDFIGEHGLEHPELSLPILKGLTECFSAEFAIRPFIIQHPEVSYRHLHEWLNHPNEHVRRLVSEGTRPRLPWGIQLKSLVQDPAPNIALLNALKNDESLYVRRSVANHINDIAKDHPDWVIEHCKQWLPNASKHTKWIIGHATRTLVKAAHPGVFALLGYSDKVQLKAAELSLNKPLIELGESMELALSLTSSANTSQKLVVDFSIHFVKANGKQSAKVFKWRNLQLAAGETLTLTKSHPIKPITTRKYYAGMHKVEVLVNGGVVAEAEFELVVG